MNVQSVYLSEASKIAINKIIKASKKPKTITVQIVMTNYYAYLNTRPRTDIADYAKIILAK